METLYKTYRAEVKGVDATEGTVDMFIPVSTDSVDRDGEIVEPLAFKKTLPKFMKRPVLVASHEYRDLTNQIGEWSKLKIEETGLNGKPKYYVNAGNEQADWGFYLASKGMAAFSIGFIPKEWEDGDGVKEPRRTYKDVELLEISQVIVPSNREAIQSIRSKGVDSVTEKLLDDVEKELIIKPEETDEYIRIPVDRGDHEGHRIRTIDISVKEGIKAIYCGTDKVIMTYLFLKSKGWDMEKARAWIKEHEKSFEPHKVSQSEIIDEIDYLKSLIEKEGLSEEAKTSANGLLKAMCTPELLKQIDMADMKKMMTMMADCEEMAGKSKDMAKGMMDDMKSKRISGSDIPVKDNGDDLSPQNGDDLSRPNTTLTNQDILESIKRIGGK